MFKQIQLTEMWSIIHCLGKKKETSKKKQQHMRSKKNPKYLNVKLESCHFLSIHLNFSHLMPIQSIIQVQSRFVYSPILTSSNDKQVICWERKSRENLSSEKAVIQSADVKVEQDREDWYMLQ